MKITKHAQSCLLVEASKARILIDPGNFVFNEEGLSADNFQNIDILVITHEHYDHFDRDNIRLILQQSDPVIISTEAVINVLKETNPNSDYRITGDSTRHDFVSLGVTLFGFSSKHGPLPNGNPAPEVQGVVIDDGTQRLFVPGDTVELNSAVTDVDIAAIPFNGVVVFTISEAKEAVEKLNPRFVIPYHYDNPKYPVNPQDFVDAMSNSAVKVSLLKNGEILEV